MQDNGPYSNMRYISESFFWNSALTEAGEAPRIQVRPDNSTSKRRNPSSEHDRRRSALRREEAAISYEKDFVKFTQLQADAKRQHEYERRGLGRIDRARIVWGKERADNDRTVMSYCIPVSPGPPSVPIVPPKRPLGPLRHSTREWDEFMDFGTHEDVGADGDGEFHDFSPGEGRYSLADRYYAERHGKELPDLPVTEMWYENAYRIKSQAGLVEDTEVYGGESVGVDECGEKIVGVEAKVEVNGHLDGLAEETVDLDAHVKETANLDDVGPNGNIIQKIASQTPLTNGTGSKAHISLSTVAEDVDPSINHPHPPYDTKDPPTEEQATAPPLTNGVHYKTTSPCQDKRSSLYINRSPSPYPPYVDSTPQHDILSSHHSSTDSTSNAPTPRHSHASSNIQYFLRSVLSTSELDLLNLAGPMPHSYASPDNPYAFDLRPRPLRIRLNQKCFSLIQHLHDRDQYFEKTMIPSLSERLERNAFAMDVMTYEAKEFSKQILELRQVIDFGNKIVTGTFEREFEMYRTLATIRQDRKFRGPMGMLRKLTGGKKEERLDEALSQGKQVLRKKELDAVMLMAEQNVRILREDAEEMSGRVDGLKRRWAALRLEKEVEPGSWRDI